MPDRSPSTDSPLFPTALARKQKKSQSASMPMKSTNRQNQTHGAGIGTGIASGKGEESIRKGCEGNGFIQVVETLLGAEVTECICLERLVK